MMNTAFPNVQLCGCGSYPGPHAYIHLLEAGKESHRGPFGSVEAGLKWIAAGVAAFESGDPTGLSTEQAALLTEQLSGLGLPAEKSETDAQIKEFSIWRLFAFRVNFPMGMAQMMGPEGLKEFFLSEGVQFDPTWPGSEPIWNYNTADLSPLDPTDFIAKTSPVELAFSA